MIPKDIVDILQKYQEYNKQEIQSINKNVDEISSDLRKIRKNLSDFLAKIMNSDYSNDKEDELMSDIKILRAYINTFSTIPISINAKEVHEVEATPSDVQISNTKPVRLFLCSDNVCPKCGCNMEEAKTTFSYKSGQKGIVTSYRCSACGTYFVADYNLEEIELKETNLDINMRYYDKVLLSDQVYVVSNINYHSTNGHRLSDKESVLTVIQADGSTKKVTVIITYCEDCNKLYMLKEEFDGLPGIPVCAIIDETKVQPISKNSSDSSNNTDSKGSKLTRYGYNVNCIDKLTSSQRRKILAIQLVSGNMEQNEIISIIDSDIQRCESSMSNGSKRDLSDAISKWREDKKFVNSVVLDKCYQYVGISQIILKFNRYI